MRRFSAHIVLIFGLVYFFTNVHAQRQTDNWYFGNKAGLSFRTGNPVPVHGGQFQSWEGSAVISDSLGNLLFYTNGNVVWNAEHDTLQNGTDLLGDTSATQSALIVPQPENEGIYYIFTTDDIIVSNGTAQTNGLNYSVVDMSGDNGLGKLTYKNIHLRDSVTEKLTAAHHANGRDIWIISHEWNSDEFYAWLLTPFGLESPVVSAAGTAHNQLESGFVINTIGYMKLSHDATKIAVAIKRANIVEVFDFNQLTGEISSPTTLELEYSPYGVEFSPDLSKLYVSDDIELYQFDLTAGTAADIQNSMSKIYESQEHFVGALQTARDGKVYVAMDRQEYLAVIENPNNSAVACNFIQQGIYLDGKFSRMGLPNFVQTWFSPSPVRVQVACINEPTVFYTENLGNSDSLRWYFDDPESGNLNTATGQNAEHIYSQSGTYEVRLLNWYNNISTEYKYLFYVEPLPEINLGADSTFCKTDSFLLDAYRPQSSYLWQDGSSDSAFWAKETKAYFVELTDIYTGCKNADTVNLIFSEIPEINIGKDTAYCENESFKLSAYRDGLMNYRWQDGSTDSIFYTNDTGTFYVSAENRHACTGHDTINLEHRLLPYFNLGNDTVICEDESYYLDTRLPENTSVLWVTGRKDSIYGRDYEIWEPDTLIVTAQNVCGTQSDTLALDFKYCGELIIPNVFTPNQDGENEFFYIKGIEETVWELQIFNRWGNEVFYSPDYQNNWQADRQQPGVYYYLLRQPESRQKYKGFVHVFK